jgi:hypothetical protein
MDADVQAFLEEYSWWDHAPKNAKWDAVVQAVRNGACVDTRSRARWSEGCTLLHVASINGLEAVVRILLVELGANPAIEDCHGWRPMHYAAYKGRLAICKLLPRTDLAMRVLCCGIYYLAPLGLAVTYSRNPREFAQWCVDQPDCLLDDTYPEWCSEKVASLPVIAVAREQRRRWSPLRAAFVGAVALVEPPQGFTRVQYNVV